MFLIQRYVFLERGLDKTKQKIYYVVTITIGIIICAFSSVEIASVFAMFVCGLNIMLAREISIMASKIEDVINSSYEIEEKIVNLIQKANNLGGTDNISVAYLEKEEEGV